MFYFAEKLLTCWNVSANYGVKLQAHIFREKSNISLKLSEELATAKVQKGS